MDVPTEKDGVSILCREYWHDPEHEHDRTTFFGSIFGLIRFKGEWHQSESGGKRELEIEFRFDRILMGVIAEQGFRQDMKRWWREKEIGQRPTYMSPEMSVMVLSLFEIKHPDEFGLFLRIVEQARKLPLQSSERFGIHSEDFSARLAA